jgi:hypothetical protein
MTGIVAVVLFILIAVVVIHAARRRREADALALDLREVTTDDVDANIRADIAPAGRPYGEGGVIVDERERTYAVATDGSVRRFAIAETADGQKDVVLVKKPGKAARKAAKRAKHADRGVRLAPVLPAARTADRASAARLAQTLAGGVAR